MSGEEDTMTTESKPGAATVIHDDKPLHFERAIADSNALWLDAAELKKLARWELKPQGICRGDLCVPIPPGREREFGSKRDGANLAQLHRARRPDGQAVGRRREASRMVLRCRTPPSATTRCDSLEAPDFELPDLDGQLHRLSDYRGKKVFLLAWASW